MNETEKVKKQLIKVPAFLFRIKYHVTGFSFCTMFFLSYIYIFKFKSLFTPDKKKKKHFLLAPHPLFINFL